MHFRLVRPMKREGSFNYQFVQRIPVDLKDRLRGMKLSIPVGNELVSLTVSPKADAIRLSLRTSSPAEIKDRQAGVASYLTRLFDALRNDTPMVLTHRNAVALAGEFFRSWSLRQPNAVSPIQAKRARRSSASEQTASVSQLTISAPAIPAFHR